MLAHRAEELNKPIQMCDALSRNLTGGLETIVANCLAHARRQFVEIHDRFPEKARKGRYSSERLLKYIVEEE